MEREELQMTFAKLDGHHFYYQVDFDRMRLYNFKGGWRDIDENSEDWMYSTLIEAENWHELYKKTGYCPMACSYFERDLWVDPDGNCYEGLAHEICAEYIGEILFGTEDMGGDELIRCGWIKLTTSCMLSLYIDHGMYNHITYEQERIIRKWAEANKVSLFEEVTWA
jgi:hypothetical protein